MFFPGFSFWIEGDWPILLDLFSQKLLQFGFSFESTRSTSQFTQAEAPTCKDRAGQWGTVLSVRLATGLTVNTADGGEVQFCKEFRVMSWVHRSKQDTKTSHCAPSQLQSQRFFPKHRSQKSKDPGTLSAVFKSCLFYYAVCVNSKKFLNYFTSSVSQFVKNIVISVWLQLKRNSIMFSL